jgi:uncharacterized protein YajQ (UPF0234 family)
MAKSSSFDITTGCDFQEIDNALNQARKEIVNRFDFKNIVAEINFDHSTNSIEIRTVDNFKLDAIWAILVSKFIARKVPLENIKRNPSENASASSVKQSLSLVQNIEPDTARAITNYVKEMKLKRTQAQNQKESIRVSSPNRDDLQKVMSNLENEDWGIKLLFGNYR